MPVNPFSRDAGLEPFEVVHETRGPARTLPVRRLPAAPPATVARHVFAGFDTVDLLALRYLGREDLYWLLLDANGVASPADLRVGETLAVPAADRATRVTRPGA